MAYEMELQKEFQTERSSGKKKWKRRIILFSVCLALSFIFWIFSTLSRHYSTTISLPIEFYNLPSDQKLSGYIPERIFLKVKAQGFTILKYKYFSALHKISINLGVLDQFKRNNAYLYFQSSREFAKLIRQNFEKDLQLEEIWPEQLLLTAENVARKKIPVLPDVEIKFAPKYHLAYKVQVIPDSIEISGLQAEIDSIRHIYTERLELNNLSEDYQKQILLKPFENSGAILLERQKVTLKIDVARFTESEIEIPIFAKNLPHGYKAKLYPERLKVTYNVDFENFDKINPELFYCYIDFNSARNASSNIAKPVLARHPEFIEIRKIEPEKVEFIIEK